MEKSIFISYSHKDADTVRTIAEIIKNATDMAVWYDSRLRGGENYFSVIANQIIKSSFFVFIVSDNSILSDWCLRELEFAASERKIIVAIWLDNISVSPRVKLVIQNTHYINYYSASNELFFDAVRKAFLGNGSQPIAGAYVDDEGGDRSWNHTYFLERQKVKKIENLLSNEKQKKYSVCFQPENAYLLGLAYELGIHVDIDLKHAEFYYKISDFKGDYDGKYLYAALRLRQEEAEPSALLAEMTDAAEHRSIFALTYLGDDYYFGRNGCDKDIEKAYEFWKQAAEAGGIVAMYYLAYGYRKGECVKKDYELACMYSLMALEYEFPRAYRILAFMYEDGELFEQDYQKAIELYEEAIKRGDYLSLCHEGWIYGQKKDYEKRRELYEKAVSLAEAGEINSGLPFYRLGYLYEYGEGVPRDIAKAVEYYFSGAERKHGNSLKYTVSTIMKIGNPKQRESYLHRALELGCRDAAYELGNIEKSRGEGKRLSEEAVKYYVKGAESGEIRCAVELVHNYSFVIGNGRDRNDRLEAIKWFQFFFAHPDEEYMDILRENNILSTYYYAYAIELDYDPNVNMPDREYVQLYFQKSLDESPMYLYWIARFVVDGYLFPEDSDSGLKLDVAHAEEMLALLEKYLAAYREYIVQNEASEASKLWRNLKSKFNRGYNKISECYNLGNTVQRNKVQSRIYKNKAEEIARSMERIAKDVPI
ncbi:MAG: toll/interleukin-1 receptor domain-containing protein [Lachnospiraceae bacterium]|nr:toll/interleukin-1 receptor domain-containing protein [Lachnospiraceae bacterium]